MTNNVGAGERIALGVGKVVEGLKRFAMGFLFSLAFFFIPWVFINIMCKGAGIDIMFFIEIILVLSAVLALLCGISIRFLALIYALSIAMIPSLIIACVIGYFFPRETGIHGPILNLWLVVPLYIVLLLLITPWIFIYILHKEGLLKHKTGVKEGVVSTIKDEFVDTAKEITRFGRRGR